MKLLASYRSNSFSDEKKIKVGHNKCKSEVKRHGKGELIKTISALSLRE